MSFEQIFLLLAVVLAVYWALATVLPLAESQQQIPKETRKLIKWLIRLLAALYLALHYGLDGLWAFWK